MTVQDAERIVMLISIVGGLFCARAWSVAAVAVIAGLLFPTLLTLFVSPEWKRFGFERYFEMQAGNFIALAGYFMLICAIFAFGALANLTNRAVAEAKIDRIQLATAPVQTPLPMMIGAIGARSSVIVQAELTQMKARLAGLGATALPGSPADFGKLIADETEKWGKVIRAANIKAE